MSLLRFSRPAAALVALSVLCPWAPSSGTGPVFDPFLQEFQVGSYLDPDDLGMAGIWPGGLLTSPDMDTGWLAAADSLLADPVTHQGTLTYRFLALLEVPPYGGRQEMARVLQDMRSPGGPSTGLAEGPPSSDFLLTERWQMEVFHALETGEVDRAGTLVRQGLASDRLSLRERERFVWQLRQRQIEHLAGGKAVPLERPWPAESDLGPYDRAAVWALWVAHRRAAGLSVLPAQIRGKDEAMRLAGLRRPELTPADLEASGFDRDLRAGLGATLFEKGDLAEHLQRYPDPPADFSAQGWWVKGQRFLQRGHAPHYEELAARDDLSPGWRLDVWRRASELRLLKGQWDRGLENLDRALEIAAEGGGTGSLRRRLRHWVEQAAVLALAQGRDDIAWRLLDRGDETFGGEALAVFREETRHWRELRTGTGSPVQDRVEAAARRVAAGLAADLNEGRAGRSEAMQQALLAAADTPVWDLWLRWGVALADPAPLSGDVLRRARSYADILQQGLAAGHPDSMADRVLAAAAHRFAGRPEILEPFLLKILDRDVGRLTHWRTPPRPSPVPGLLPVLRRSQLDMHAALGLALLTGDMRGTVAIGYELPGEGLTNAEKRRFLYPLPAEGPIREALLAAESEPALILAVARNESLFEPAVRSRAGALGWMQIMPFHFPRRGALPGQRNWAVPAVSIQLGDNLLAENRRRYGGDPYLTLAAYNAGPGAADRWRRQLGGTDRRDIYLAWIGYPETRNYVEKVLIDREIYAWILSGGAED